MSATFQLDIEPIRPERLLPSLNNQTCGAVVTFDGRVRDHNDGRSVLRLDYTAHQKLAVAEGQRVVDEALEKFAVEHVVCVHRIGHLAIGDIAVWVGVSAAHRGAAFEASRYVIDEVKQRVPIWKNEFYSDGTEAWVDPTKTSR
ncbi:MAG: molybdopterin-converting factor chain 2 [Lysobacteraceae bacterium]|nr:MAG: molybdopterin-converting factor chain 2 [Xanthomonadaceae bacterium]